MTTAPTDAPTTALPDIHEAWRAGEHGTTRYWLGARNGSPVLLIHGYGGLIEHWRRFWGTLAPHHTVAALDLYNFGYSSHLTTPPSTALWAAQVVELIQELFTEPVTLIGHSMGGMVAGQVAHDYPALVRDLVLIDSMGLRPEEDPSPLASIILGVMRSPILGDGLATFFSQDWAIESGLRAAYHDQSRITPTLVTDLRGPLRRAGGPQAYLAVSRQIPTFTLAFAPGDVQQPTLIVWGAHDRSMPATLAARLQRELYPQAEIAIIEDAAHCPFDEQPAATAAVVLPWLAQRNGTA